MLEGSFSARAKEAEAGSCGKEGGLNPGWENRQGKTSRLLLLPSPRSTKGLFPMAPLLPNHQKANPAETVETCHLLEQALSWE